MKNCGSVASACGPLACGSLGNQGGLCRRKALCTVGQAPGLLSGAPGDNKDSERTPA